MANAIIQAKIFLFMLFSFLDTGKFQQQVKSHESDVPPLLLSKERRPLPRALRHLPPKADNPLTSFTSSSDPSSVFNSVTCCLGQDSKHTMPEAPCTSDTVMPLQLSASTETSCPRISGQLNLSCFNRCEKLTVAFLPVHMGKLYLGGDVAKFVIFRQAQKHRKYGHFLT